MLSPIILGTSKLLRNISRMSFSRGPTGPSGGISTAELNTLITMVDRGISPKVLLNHLAPSFPIPPGANDMMLWQLLASMIDPPRRRNLSQYNTLEDAVELIRKSKKIIILSGAGISTSAGLPDFRSRNGIYVQIHAEYPDLQDPKSMFDIEYFRENPMPFYQFAKALYPGQYKPTIGHKFIKCIEDHNKLLRNYSQNIDTLEKQAGIKRVVECHGSFARATCTNCKHNVDGDEIRDDIMNQKIPYCPKCQTKDDGPEDGLGVMKPNIVFFGEQLGDDFHNSLEEDKDQADLLIVIGSSLKVKPVALIPKCVPSEVPQILINKEPLDYMGFDIELLGDCDDIIQEICLRLGQGWTDICETRRTRLNQIVGLPTEIAPNTIQQPQPSNQSNEGNNHIKDNHNKSFVACDARGRVENHIEDSAVASGSRGVGELGEHDTEEQLGNRAQPNPGTTDHSMNNELDLDIESAGGSRHPAPAYDNDDNNNDDDDDDDDGEWEDIEIVGASPSSSILNPKAKASFHLPDSSFIYLEPKTYLFPGAELTNAQLARYTKNHSEPHESSDTSSSE